MADRTPFNIFDSILGPTAEIKAQNNAEQIVRANQAQIGGARGQIAAEMGAILKQNPQATPQDLLRAVLQSPNLADAFVNDPDSLNQAINAAKAGGFTPPEPVKLGAGDTLYQPGSDGYKLLARGSGVDAQGNAIKEVPAEQRLFDFYAAKAGATPEQQANWARRKMEGDQSVNAEQISLLKAAGVPEDRAVKIVTGAIKPMTLRDQYGKEIGVQIVDTTNGTIITPQQLENPSSDPNDPANMIQSDLVPEAQNVIDPAAANAAGFTGASGPAPAVGGNVIEPGPAAGVVSPQAGAAPAIAPAMQAPAAAAQATSPQSSRVRQIQSKTAATRRQPLNPDLVATLDGAIAGTGDDLVVDVYSGGQAGKGEGGPRTGSTRHDHGNAGDIYLRDRASNRVLDFRNDADRPRIVNFIQQAIANGANGIGAGEGYMGKGIHVGYGPKGQQGGPVTVWGAGGSGGNAPAWLRRAVSVATQGKFVDGGSFAASQTAPGGTPPTGKQLKGVLGDKSEAFLGAGPLGSIASTAQNMARLLDPNFKFEGPAGEANTQQDALQQMALSMRNLRDSAGDEFNRQEFKQLQDSTASLFSNWTSPKAALEGAANIVADANAMYDANLQILQGGGQSTEEMKRARSTLNMLDTVLSRWPTQEQIQNQIGKLESGDAEVLTLGNAAKTAKDTFDQQLPAAQSAIGEAEQALGVGGQSGAQSAAVSPNQIKTMTLDQLEALGQSGAINNMDAAGLAALKQRLRDLTPQRPSGDGVPRTP